MVICIQTSTQYDDNQTRTSIAFGAATLQDAPSNPYIAESSRSLPEPACPRSFQINSAAPCEAALMGLLGAAEPASPATAIVVAQGAGCDDSRVVDAPRWPVERHCFRL